MSLHSFDKDDIFAHYECYSSVYSKHVHPWQCSNGVLGIVLIAKEEMILAVYCVLIALVLDFFDGFVARLLGVQGKLGAELDSLADMITFGALPGVILFQMISISRGIYFTDLSQWTTTDLLSCSVALVVPMAAHIA